MLALSTTDAGARIQFGGLSSRSSRRECNAGRKLRYTVTEGKLGRASSNRLHPASRPLVPM